MKIKRLPSRLLPFVAAASVALTMAACRPGQIEFAALSNRAMPTSEQGLRAEANRLGPIYDRKPGERNVSLRYGLVLRQLGLNMQAVAVLQRATLANPGDQEVSAAYGKALSDAGELKQAAEVLANAHTPDRPNWRILSAQGSVADKMGDHPRAQDFYTSALRIAPGEPTVLSNLGLSYALSSRLADAERTLTQAASHPSADDRVRANLAAVQSLIAERRSGRGDTNTWAQIKKAEAGTRR